MSYCYVVFGVKKIVFNLSSEVLAERRVVILFFVSISRVLVQPV